MANKLSKTISLRELYAMMQQYKNIHISVFSAGGAAGMSLSFPIKEFRYSDSGKTPFLVHNGVASFILQADTVKVSDLQFESTSCSFTLCADKMNFRCRFF